MRMVCSELREECSFYSGREEERGTDMAMIGMAFWSAKGQGGLRVGFLALRRCSEACWHE